MEIIFTATLMETTLIVTLLGLFFLIRYIFKPKKNKSVASPIVKHEDPVISKAIILSLENTGNFFHGHVQMKIQLQVIPVKGRNFVTEIKEVLTPEDMKSMRTGSTISVKYNPANRKEVSLVKAA